VNKSKGIFSAAFLAAALVSGAGLMSVAGCASTETRSSTGEYIDDTVITAKVKSAIMSDSDVKFTEVNVETFKGVVQLSGFVSSREEINRAVALAREVDGVTSVKNDMRVR
jgi:osmotically-inducible protein OsmY